MPSIEEFTEESFDYEIFREEFRIACSALRAKIDQMEHWRGFDADSDLIKPLVDKIMAAVEAEGQELDNPEKHRKKLLELIRGILDEIFPEDFLNKELNIKVINAVLERIKQ